MSYDAFFVDNRLKKSKIGIIGATKGYGYTLLSQISFVESIEIRAICSRHPDECITVLVDQGYSKERIVVSDSLDEINQVSEDAIIVTSNTDVVLYSGVSSIIECTGNVELGATIAEQALEKGINVYMVSKETDSICGTSLNQIAEKNGVVYTLVNGDQPKNLMNLYSFGTMIGLDIVAVGKSSEYDFVYNEEKEEITYTSEEAPVIPAGDIKKYWHYNGIKTLECRRNILQEYLQPIPADLCEMNLVSNLTGYMPSVQSLSYPVLKINELAEVFVPEKDGGILKNEHAVDVFCQLRTEEEASFAGGVFIVFRCKDQGVWNILKAKGHVISKNGKYGCLYWPYHFMGVETPLTILIGDLTGKGTDQQCRQHTIMAAKVVKDLCVGTEFMVGGHHHSIEGLSPVLIPSDERRDIIPFYLLNGAKLVKAVKPGELLTFADVEYKKGNASRLFYGGMELTSDK